MPETSRLYLHSPAGSDVAVYKWPLHVSESWNEPHEIVETIRWVCNDFPELKLAVENYVLNNFDPANFESMKLLCEKYNRAVDNIRKLWSGRQPPPCIDAPPSLLLLKHILNQVYNHAISRPEELNTYQAFSPEVYGETSFELVTEMISATHLGENDVFLDLGSGVGQVVLQVAASAGCRSYGIEKAEIPAKYAEEMNRQFVKWMDFYGKSYGDYELLKGDFLDPQFEEIIQSATVIFCNNFAFGPSLNHKLKLKFQNLRDGVKIVSSREFCPLNFRVTERNLSDIGAMMRVAELSPLKGSVSWTSKPVSYYLHRIDRSKMEEFFHKQKHSDEKSEGSMSLSSGSSSSSESLSEDSSLDSSDDEDLFKRPYEEMHHFPPVPNKGVSSNNGSGYFHHSSHTKKSIPSNVTSSAVQKKVTPPSGLTHLPRPHPQSVLNEQFYSNSCSHSSSGVNHTFTSAIGGNRQPLKKSTKNQGNATRKRRNKSSMDFTPLLDLFQEQMMCYIDNMDNPQFMSWVTDSMEKEKMKKKHLQGVIEHLESEVSTLSVETINNMKDSMSHLGITNLTPEGLLLGAKDIVMLNRQLRKEVQMLEKDVYKLKEENGFITCLCKQADETLSNDSGMSIKKQTTIPLISQVPLVSNDDLTAQSITNPTIPSVSQIEHTSSTYSCLTSTDASVVDSLLPGTPIESSKSSNNGDSNVSLNTLPQVQVLNDTDVEDSVEESLTISESSLPTTTCNPMDISPAATPTSNDLFKPMPPCTCITINEPYSGSVELEEYEKYQISLETIDQAVLELGPFAKDVVTEQRPDLPPLNWQHPALESHAKKEKRKPYSPPTGRMIRKGRASGDCMSPMSSVDSPVGVESMVKHPAVASSQRRPNKKKQLQDHESSPLLIGDSASNQNEASVKPLSLVTSDMSKPNPSSTQENFAIEAMLALSSSGTSVYQPSNEEDSSGVLVSSSTTGQDVPLSIAPPKVHFPSLPPLNRMMESSSGNSSSRRRGPSHPAGSNSNIRSSMDDSTSNTFSPLPSSLHIPPMKPSEEAVKMAKYDDKKDPNPPYWMVSAAKSTESGSGLSVSASAGFPYQLMTLSAWNPMGGGGLQPNTYVPSYPPLSRTTELPSSSVDISIPNSFRSSVFPPSYYFYNPYGLTTPLANHLITSSTASIQSPSVSSPLPTAHPSLSYNPYMTPPTLHPLNDSTKPKDVPNTAPWMMLGGTQYPQSNLLNSNQFATGLGIATPHLSLFPGLQGPNLLGGGIATSSADQSDNSKKRSPPDHLSMESSSLLYPTALARNVTGTTGSLDENVLRKQTFGNVPSIVPSLSPSQDLMLPPSATNSNNKRDKVDRRKKLKIHQINQEDFSNKSNVDKTGYDRRSTRKFTEWEIPSTQFTSVASNADSVNANQVSQSRTSNIVVSNQVPPTNPVSLPKAVIPSAGGASLISDTRLPTLVTMSSMEESDPIIKVDDDEEEDISSEGTVSVTGSPSRHSENTPVACSTDNQHDCSNEVLQRSMESQMLLADDKMAEMSNITLDNKLGNTTENIATTGEDNQEAHILPDSPKELVISQHVVFSPTTQEDKSIHINNIKDEPTPFPPVSETAEPDDSNEIASIDNEVADEDYVDIGNSSIDYSEFSPGDMNDNNDMSSPRSVISTTSIKEFPPSVSSSYQPLVSHTVVTAPSSISDRVTIPTQSLGGLGLMDFNATIMDKHRRKKSPKPKQGDHHGDKSLSRPHPPSGEDQYMLHMHNKSNSYESRRSLTPSHSCRSISPVPNQDGQYNSLCMKRSSKSPDKDATLKKRERLGDHAHHNHHHRIHHGNDSGGSLDSGGLEEHPWTIGGSHSVIGGSLTSEKYDSVGGPSQKRHNHYAVKDGETQPTKKHKIKRPKGTSSHHHHHHRHTQY